MPDRSSPGGRGLSSQNYHQHKLWYMNAAPNLNLRRTNKPIATHITTFQKNQLCAVSYFLHKNLLIFVVLTENYFMSHLPEGRSSGQLPDSSNCDRSKLNILFPSTFANKYITSVRKIILLFTLSAVTDL